MKKHLITLFLLLSVSLILISWGSIGHSKISEASSLSFNNQMHDFSDWVTFIKDHASDADYRKSTDPTEAPKHYIDIDNYSAFVNLGRIPQTYDSVITIYGNSFVIDNGILPWATERTFDSLKNCFGRLDFANAKIFAADLGHYVADGHMPLHITKNYNGQYTGNTGIHSRYESTMVNGHIGEFIYFGYDVVFIDNVNQYIFDYIYQNYTYCDSVLNADNYALGISSNTSSTAYKDALWAKSKSFTVPLFEKASHSVANLIYTAWVQAGSPSLVQTAISDPEKISNAVLEPNIPNPFLAVTHICYTISETTPVLLEVRNSSGQIVTTLVKEIKGAGKYSCDWVPENEPAGIYYLVLNSGKFIQIQNMMYLGKNH